MPIVVQSVPYSEMFNLTETLDPLPYENFFNFLGLLKKVY
jgi:hypothetical protein